MRKISLTSLFLSCILFLSAQDVVVSVDVQAEQSPISPYVYGANVPTQNASAMRWGGNRTTTYNWENNYSNAGEDYNQMSDEYFTNGMSSEDKVTPGIPVIKMTQQAHSRNQYALVTLQAAGFVAADRNGQVSEEEVAPSERWDSIVFRKGSAFSLSPDKTDGIVYIDEYVNYLSEILGRVGEGGIDAFGIDNEPDLWGSTHPLIRPEKLSLEEFYSKTVEVASIVKEINPDAEVYGPMFSGWSAMQGMNMDVYSKWTEIRNREGYYWFVDYYLDSLRQVEELMNQRLLDVLAVHWYPEARGENRIVDLFGTMSYDELTTDAMISARLQAPRSLWDPAYVETSWISNQVGAIKLIPRLRDAIETYYPGTKLAFTEFKYGAETHFSGGLALADVLGVFGREGVYMASKWDATSSYAASAYELYLNYDGNGSSFGSTSVQAEVANNSIFSTFASTDENGVLRLVVINKTDSDKSSEFSLAGGFYSKASVYGFDQTSSTVREFAAVDTITGDSFNYLVPAYSALLFEVSPLEQTQFVDASVMDANTSEIIVSFDSDITLVNASQAASETVVIVSGDTVSVTDVLAGASAHELKFVLESPVLSTDSLITLSYAGSSITGFYDIAVASVSQKTVYNEMATAPLVVLGAETNEFGTAVFVNFSKEIDPVGFSNTSIDVNDNELSFTIDSIMVSVDDAKGLTVFVSPRLLIYDTIYIENGTHTISALDGSETGNFSYLVENNGPRTSPQIDSIVLSDNFSIKLFANVAITIDEENCDDFIVTENGVPLKYSANVIGSVITLSFDDPLFFEHDYSVSYVDSANVKSIYGGYLNSFIDEIVENNLTPSPTPVSIPAQIEAEDYAYVNGSVVLEECLDDGGGEHIGFIGKNDVFGYSVECVEAGTYTLTLRHAGSSQSGQVSVWINNEKHADLYVPATGGWNTWKSSSVPIELVEGHSYVEIYIESAGFNLNWISFTEGSNPSPAIIQRAQTDVSGSIIYVYYDRKIVTLPEFSELELLVNDIPVQILSAEYPFNDTSRIAFTIDTVIYINQTVTISYNETSARTSENGIFEPVNNFDISNKSQQVPDEIAEPHVKMNVYPVPAKVGEKVFISSDMSCSNYAVYDMRGKQIKCGKIEYNTSITFKESGVYIIKIYCSGIEKFILVPVM